MLTLLVLLHANATVSIFPHPPGSLPQSVRSPLLRLLPPHPPAPPPSAPLLALPSVRSPLLRPLPPPPPAPLSACSPYYPLPSENSPSYAPPSVSPPLRQLPSPSSPPASAPPSVSPPLRPLPLLSTSPPVRWCMTVLESSWEVKVIILSKHRFNSTLSSLTHYFTFVLSFFISLSFVL